jgi:hypothetical protein
MNNNTLVNQDFPIQFNEYAAFDATSLKSLMQDRLTSNQVFKDHVYEGSNFNNFLDVIAYSYNVLLYYLNQTGNESLFSSSQIYENMNKIVKLVNYKPVGPSTSLLIYNAIANNNLPVNIYTIPRYSYFTINDIYYSFNNDLTFVKSITGSQILNDLTERSLLHQGEFVEYPVFVATGENFEEISIVSVNGDGVNELIDNNNIHVFIRGNSGKWSEYKRVDNIYLQNGIEEVFEVRLNENQRYSIKFGNNVTGRKLTTGNLVAIYYLRTDGENGRVGPDTLNNNQLFTFNTERYNTIMNDVRAKDLNIITLEQSNNIAFTNSNASIDFTPLESVKSIRQNAPNFFKRQGRLVTVSDFKSYLKQNYSNLITDVEVVNNWEYIDGHIKYLYNLGLDNPLYDSRVLYNQVNFADSCNFNNIYIYVVPKTLINNNFSFERGFLNLGLKDYLLNNINDIKLSTIELVFMDPVYYSVDFGCALQNDILNKDLNIEIQKQTKFIVIKTPENNVGSNDIKEKISNVFKEYFSFKNLKLGQVIDIEKISQQIFSIGGIDSFYTQNNDIIMPGLNLLGYNPAYAESKEDLRIINQSFKLPYFKIPFWNNIEKIIEKIEVKNSTYLSSGNREY